MHVQIIANQQAHSTDEAIAEHVASLLQSIKNIDTTKPFTWVYAKAIDLNADLYFKVIDRTQVQIGFNPATVYWKAANDEPHSAVENLHWVTIKGEVREGQNLLSQLLLFVVGLTCIPSQMGTYMMDLPDMKVALQCGNQAQLMMNTVDNLALPTDRKIAGSLILCNGSLPMSVQLNHATSIIPQSLVISDYLSILNLTDTHYLPQSTMLLTVY